jgi:O-antigen ligase
VSRLWYGRRPLVTFLVLATLLLCMSAPEELAYSPQELFYTSAGSDLNPYVGAVKLTLLGLAVAILLLCRGRKRNWAIAVPFIPLMAWAVLSWVVTGAGRLPARNLVSSFGGLLVLAALCAATDRIGGVRNMARLLGWALALTATASVVLGFLGLQAMPGQDLVPGQLEWFHGVGLAGYALAGCAALIAWVLGRHLSGAGVPMEAEILLLLGLAGLAFYRAFLIGMVASIAFATVLAFWRSGQIRRGLQRAFQRRYKRLLLSVVAALVVGAVIFFVKTGTRPKGEALSGRLIIWPIEIASVIQHPLFGLGPFGDVELLRFKEDLPQLGSAHCDYLAAAVCYGIPGLVLFVVALFGTWRKIARFTPLSREETACRYAALFSLVALSITIIAENVIRDPRLFSLYLLFPALCLSRAALRRQIAAR